MNKNKKNLIVTLADTNFVDQAKQLFSSVYFNSAWAGDYLLLSHGLSRDDTAWFESRGILVFNAPLLSHKPIGANNYPPIVLSKFYLFQEYFKKWQKIIFLDADIIVRASLDRLLALDGFNAPEAVTLRLKGEFNLKADAKNVKNKLKAYCLRSQAFNSGVFVFDTDLIFSDSFKKLKSLYEELGYFSVFGEEATFNLFFYKNWKILPLIYNFNPWYMKIVYGINKKKVLAVILHFVCAKVKPWHKESPYYKEWVSNLKKADAINLAERKKATKIFSNQELFKYKINLCLRGAFLYFPLVVDRYIGLFGQLIKKNNPKLYEVIRLRKNE